MKKKNSYRRINKLKLKEREIRIGKRTKKLRLELKKLQLGEKIVVEDI